MSQSMSTFDLPGVRFDDLGPRRIECFHDPMAGLHAAVVIDTIAACPSGGGVRMAPDVSLGEIARLARAMSLKYALLSMPIGGAKAGIRADPNHPARDAVIRAFLDAVKRLVGSGAFVPGPDMGTSASDFGGPQIDERLTGYGVVVAAKSAAELAGRSLEGARIAVEGFGKVGSAAAAFFAREGARVVAVSTAHAAIHAPHGLDVEALIALRARGGAIESAARVSVLPRESLFTVPCDVLVPCARPDAIHHGNVHALEAKLVVPGSNVPYAEGTLEMLASRGIMAIPDFVANAGGVLATVCALQRLTGEAAREVVRDTIDRNVRRVLERARERGIVPYSAAIELARERLQVA